MSTHHHWFRSGPYSLLGHLDLPDGETARMGLVIIPPFGWEDVCSYRPLRSMARRFSAEGIATLRYDLPGTGDSSGSALDQNLFQAWVQSVKDAAAHLVAHTSVESVSLLGIRLGAILGLSACASASESIDFRDLVLWGGASTGRSLLRELQAFHNLEVKAGEEGKLPPPPPLPGLEVAGFLLSPETQNAIEAFQARNLPVMKHRRVLLLSRDKFPHDAKLTQSLEQAGSTVLLKAGDGYEAMMAAPHEALPSPKTDALIIEFLKEGTSQASTTVFPPFFQQGVALATTTVEDEYIETVQPIRYGSCSLFSVVTQPKVPLLSDYGILLLNAGGIRHIGPNRMWVEVARRWAAQGIPSLRLDFDEVGESGADEQPSVDSLHETDLVRQINLAAETLSSLLQSRRFVTIGLCSGAFGAFQAMTRNPSLRGAILLNPRLFFWDRQIERRRLMQRATHNLCDSSSWHRLVRGDVELARVKQVVIEMGRRLVKGRPKVIHQLSAPNRALTAALEKMRELETRVTVVFADHEPLFADICEGGQLSLLEQQSVNIIQAGPVGHTIRPIWAQRFVHNIIDREIEAVVRTGLSFDVSKKIA